MLHIHRRGAKARIGVVTTYNCQLQQQVAIKVREWNVMPGEQMANAHTHTAIDAFAPKWVVYPLIALVAYFSALKLLIAIASAATATLAVAIAFCATLMRQRICRFICACMALSLTYCVDNLNCILKWSKYDCSYSSNNNNTYYACTCGDRNFWSVCKHRLMQTIACFATLTHLGSARLKLCGFGVAADIVMHTSKIRNIHTLWQCRCTTFLHVN